MARINVEESIWSDHRVRALSRMIGSDAMAIGCLIMAWHTAQEFYLINGVGMPIDQFYLLEHADKMKTCLLAEERGEFVYLAGSKEQFGWLISAKNSGQNGGRERVRRENLKKEQEKDGFVEIIDYSVKGPLSDPQATLKRPLSESNPLYSLLSSLNSEDSHKCVSSDLKSPPSEFISLFKACEVEWINTLLHFKTNRPSTANDKKVIKQLIDKHGHENAKTAIIGMRFHPKDKNFDPGQWLAISKLLDDEKFELALNRGAKSKPIETDNSHVEEFRRKKEEMRLAAK